jgi:RNA polymerase sigma-B factor
MAAAVLSEPTLAQLEAAYWPSRDPDLEQALVQRHAGLASSLARRFAHGRDGEDAVQVATCGLLLALRRYDPNRGVAFTTFAWATISGELKRFVRDTGWVARVDRSLQERHLRVVGVVEELSRDLGREPTIDEVAQRAGFSPSVAGEALAAMAARRPTSIHTSGPSVDLTVEERLGQDDPGFHRAEHGDELARLLSRLPRLERSLVWGYWCGDRTQTQLADEHGLTQMQVSRLLRRSIDRLRALATAA